jgi:multidrug resistance efflux pump
VKKGALVVVLDDRDFVATVDQKATALDSARAREGAVKASIEQAIAHVSSLEATVESDQATNTRVSRTLRRPCLACGLASFSYTGGRSE